jgi:hypothetical protein
MKNMAAVFSKGDDDGFTDVLLKRVGPSVKDHFIIMAVADFREEPVIIRICRTI